MSAQEVGGLLLEGDSGVWPAKGQSGWVASSDAAFSPSAERLVYEVRQKCRNIEGESVSWGSGCS